MIVDTEFLAHEENGYTANNKGNYKGNIYMCTLYIPKIRFI